MKSFLRIVLVAGLLAGAVAAGVYYFRGQETAAGGAYRTQAARVMDIQWSISATGTVVPEEVVDVGAQVNGQIAAFGEGEDGKPVDYGSTVAEGGVLARIDDVIYAADVATSRAQRSQAEAQVRVAEANVSQAEARLEQAARDWARAQKLGQSMALSQADFDAAKSNYEQAEAAVAVARASVGQARAQVQIATAAVERAERNLNYCTIRSPVSGVIIDRRVDIGQTVVSSLNAPSLFLIARDLRRMQVLVQVNEADVGHVRPGQPVTFTVDAFPSDRFRGEVRRVRLNATMTQNVVTYTVEIATDNASLRLLPYLTANVTFVIERREGVLAVPNAAMRWAPEEPAGSAAPRAAGGAGPGGAQAGGQGRPGGGAGAARGEGGGRRGARPTKGMVYVVGSDGRPRGVEVTIGLTDGSMTEVVSGDLREGAEVIVGEQPSGAGRAGSAASPQTTNPFAPQFPGRGGRGR
jgi:HlyD family secretion protein